jgi:hypothetical protein
MRRALVVSAALLALGVAVPASAQGAGPRPLASSISAAPFKMERTGCAPA